MGERFGGRSAGTPNKATKQVKDFLAGVFEEVFAREEFRKGLIEDIVTRTIDTKLLITLLGYHAGRPAQAVDHTHSGTVTLAQIIAGRVPSDDVPPEE